MTAQPRKLRDYAVVAFVIVCLLLGWLIKAGVENRVVRFADTKSGVSFSYPANWLRLPEEGAIVTIVNPQSPGALSTKFTVETKSLTGNQDLMSLAAQVSAEKVKSLSLYRTIAMDRVGLAGVDGIRIDYAYAVDPVGVVAGRTSVPRVARAVDVLAKKGDLAYYFTFVADDAAYDGSLPAFEKILKTISVH